MNLPLSAFFDKVIFAKRFQSSRPLHIKLTFFTIFDQQGQDIAPEVGTTCDETQALLVR